jgi:hypothetical protein
MKTYKPLTKKQYDRIAKNLNRVPSILIVGEEGGRATFQINAPQGRNEAVTEMLLSAMLMTPAFADCVKTAAIVYHKNEQNQKEAN